MFFSFLLMQYHTIMTLMTRFSKLLARNTEGVTAISEEKPRNQPEYRHTCGGAQRTHVMRADGVARHVSCGTAT
jgi:hypothetical protein